MGAGAVRAHPARRKADLADRVDDVAEQAIIKSAMDFPACGELKTAHSGYPGSHDRFYVGIAEGGGRVCQQGCIDTCCTVAQAKLYQQNTDHSRRSFKRANERVGLPFDDGHGLQVLPIMTDQSTGFCNRVDRHDFQLLQAINDMDHTGIRVKSPQINAIGRRFHKMMLQEFCQHDNHARTHQGEMCCGRPPFQTMTEGKEICKEKFLNQT